ELRSNCAASLSRFGVERYLTLARGPDRRTLPLNPVKILDHDGVENRHEYQRHEGGYAQAANLCVAQWLPKRTAMDCQGEQAQHRSADGDEHGAQPHDAGVDERLVEWLAEGMPLLDEVEEHDYMADDDTHQADDTEECHETERRVQEHERNQRAGRTE